MTGCLHTSLAPDTAAAVMLTRDAAKEHLRYEGTDEDGYVDLLIAAVSGHLDGPFGLTGRALLTQRWSAAFPAPAGRSRLRFPVEPFGSVISVSYYDRAGAVQTIDAAQVTAITGSRGTLIEPKAAWPSMYDRPDAVTVVAECGYGAAGDVPAPLIQAAKLILGHWYENREAVTEGRVPSAIPMGVHALISPYRAGWIA